MLPFLEELRALLDRYPDVAALGEVSAEDSLATMAEYTKGRRLHMGYSFELLTDDFSARHIRDTVEKLEAIVHDGWPCWAISNHDVKRVASRWGGNNPPEALPTLLTALVCSLRGSVCIYQGEELGLTEAELPYEAIQDPVRQGLLAHFKGRDGCRTPMPWDESDHAGFSAAKPWLPIPEAHRGRSVASQEAQAESPLQRFRQFLRWRKTQPALIHGSIRFIDAPEQVLAFVREHEGVARAGRFNLSATAAAVALPESLGVERTLRLEGHGYRLIPLAGTAEARSAA
jgi:alpha-glucosidase